MKKERIVFAKPFAYIKLLERGETIEYKGKLYEPKKLLGNLYYIGF